MHSVSIIEQSHLSAEQQRLIHETLSSILASSYFTRSKRYPALLEYVVRHTLEGDVHALNERTVGMEVFEREANFDPVTDSVVRMAASEVRKRLALYFSVNPSAPVHIELPSGSYMAEFRFRAPTSEHLVTSVSEHAEDPLRNDRHLADQRALLAVRRAPRWQLSFSIAAIAAVAVSLAIWFALQFNPAQPVDRFWAPLDKSKATVLISLGAPYDPGPPSWAVGLPDTALVQYMRKLPNNPVPDIGAADLINEFLAGRGTKSEIRMGTSTEFADLHRAPAVLLGVGHISPWTGLLSTNMRFQFQESADGAVHWIYDRSNPGSLDWKVDLRLPYDQVGSDYALITRQLNPTTGQWWVGIGGTTGISTDEAVKMLMDRVAMKKLEAQLPRGWQSKNLQLVVEFTLVNGSCGGSHIVASNVW